MPPVNEATRKPATATPARTNPAAAPAARNARNDLRQQAGAAGFEAGSRMLSPAAPARAPRVHHVDQSISDRPYGWHSKFDVSFSETECNVAIKVKFEPQEGVGAEDVTKVQDDTRAAFAQYFDNKFRLTDGASKKVYTMRVALVFTDRSPHLTVKLRKGSGRDNLSNWFVDSKPIVRAHELGHQLGLKDEYIDAGAESRKDKDAPGVRTDNSLMGNFWTEGVDKASVKTRHAQDIANLIGGETGGAYTAAPVPAQ
jgi:hypothetical protein